MRDCIESPVWVTVERPPAPERLSRRQLIDRLAKMGAGALAVAMGGGGIDVLTRPSPAAASPAARPAATRVERMFRYGMVIDTRRCVGCRACVVACKAENKTPPGVSYNVVIEDTRDSLDDKPLFLTKPCFHCEDPPCTDVCPVSATFKRERDGIVVIDYDRCIGCRYCITACPYGARTFDFGEEYAASEEDTPWAAVPSPEYGQYRERGHEQSPIGNVRKCTFCLHLQDEEGRYDQAAGRWPACAKTCTGHAIHFGDFNDRNSEVSRLVRERQAIRLKEELGTEPNVYYLL
jgi:molybdopterin-containing oxidoreductase family iron-sulfur binding subunit